MRVSRNSDTFSWVFSLFIVALISVSSCLFSYHFLLKPQEPFFWDEAHHAENALYIYHSLEYGNWNLFWEFTNNLILWPFLHSWVVGLFLLISGVSTVNARLPQLLLFFLSAWMLFITCRSAFTERKKIIGVIAVLLFSTSPLMLFYSSTCMIELLGVFLALSFFCLYFKALKNDKNKYYAWSGIILSLLYLTKYTYGLLILFPFSLDVFLQLFAERKKRRFTLLKNAGIVVAGFIFPISIWLLVGNTSAKLNILPYYFRGGMGGTWLELNTLDRALFYVRSLANIYTYSIWIFFIFLGGIIFGLLNLKNPKIRLMILTAAIILIICSIGKNEQDRYIVLAFSIITILGAGAAIFLYGKIKPVWVKNTCAGILLLLIILDLPGFPSRCQKIGSHIGALGSFRYPIDPELKYSVCLIPGLYPSLLKQPYSHLNPTTNYCRAKHNMNDVWRFIADKVQRRGYLCCLSTFQAFSAHLRTWYSYLSKLLISSRWDPSCDFFAYVLVNPESPYYNKEYPRSFEIKNLHWINFLEQLAARGGIRLIGTRYYPDLFVTVKVYVKTPTFNEIVRPSR